MRSAISSTRSLELKLAETQRDLADVDPDAIVEMTPLKTKSRSVLRLSVSRPNQSRYLRPRQLSVERQIGPPSPALTVSDTDETTPRPGTPPARRTGSATLKIPAASQTLRRSPRRRLNDPSILRETSKNSLGHSVKSTSGQSASAILFSAVESQFEAHTSRDKSASDSFLPSEPTLRPVRRGVMHSKAESQDDIIEISDAPLQRSVARIPAPQPNTTMFGKLADVYEPIPVVRASSPGFREVLAPSRVPKGTGRTKTIRPITEKMLINPVTGRASRPKSNSSIYPHLPAPLPLKVSSVNTLGKGLARSTAAQRSKSVRSLARMVEPSIEKVGEKRRLGDREGVENRLVKKGRVDVLAAR